MFKNSIHIIILNLNVLTFKFPELFNTENKHRGILFRILILQIKSILKNTFFFKFMISIRIDIENIRYCNLGHQNLQT